MPSPLWFGSNILEEQAGSPDWGFADQVTLKRVWRGSYTLAKNSAPLKGSLGTGEAAGMVVAKSRVTRERGGIGLLTVEYETSGQPAQGSTLPADEAGIETQQTDVVLRKHTRYSSLSESLRESIKTLMDNADASLQGPAKTAVNANALAKELYDKLLAGATHFALWVPVYKLKIHSWTAPAGNVGGFRQAPPNVPILPPAGYVWLRQGDKISFNGSVWVLEQSWIAAPEWDTDIYAIA